MSEQEPSSAFKNYPIVIKNFTPRARKIFIFLIVILGLFLVLFSGHSAYKAKMSRTVNLRMEALGELNTQAAYYTNVQVIRNSRTVLGINVPFTQNQYIYSYDGTIKAGIDFSKVRAVSNDVNKTITVYYPQAYITSNSVDENSLQIYDEERNIFTPLKLEDIQLSREMMKKEASEKAIQNGILDEAETTALRIIENFLYSDPIHDGYTIIFIKE